MRSILCGVAMAIALSGVASADPVPYAVMTYTDCMKGDPSCLGAIVLVKQGGGVYITQDDRSKHFVTAVINGGRRAIRPQDVLKVVKRVSQDDPLWQAAAEKATP